MWQCWCAYGTLFLKMGEINQLENRIWILICLCCETFITSGGILQYCDPKSGSSQAVRSCARQRPGIFARFRRQLRTALRAGDKWVEILPLVQKGIRATVNAETDCSVAELSFEDLMCLPGETRVSTAIGFKTDTSSVLSRIRLFAQSLRPTAIPIYAEARIHRSASSSHMFRLCNRVLLLMQFPYDGPFEVRMQEVKERVFEQLPSGAKRILEIIEHHFYYRILTW